MNQNDGNAVQGQELFIEELDQVSGAASGSSKGVFEALANVQPGSIHLTSKAYGEEGAPYPAGFTPSTTHAVSGLDAALASLLESLRHRR